MIRVRLVVVAVSTLASVATLIGASLCISPSRTRRDAAANSSPPTINEAVLAPSNVAGRTSFVAPSAANNQGWPCLLGLDGHCRVNDTIDATSWTPSGPPEVWRRTIGRGYSAPVVQRDRLVLFHRSDDRELLTALDARTGRLLWEQSDPTSFRCRYEYSDGPYGTPHIDDDRVYAVGAEARLSCRSMSDGRLLWQHDLRSEFNLRPGPYGFGAQLHVNEHHVVLNVGGSAAGIVAFDKLSGDVCWTATDQAASFTMPRPVRVENRDFLVVLTDVGLVSLVAETGDVCDSFPFRSKIGDSVSAVTPLVRGNRVLLVAGRGPGTVCLEVLPDGRLRQDWHERRALDSLFNTLVLADEFVFGFTSTRQGAASLRCLELRTGRVAWDFPSDLERGQAVAIGDTLVILGERGHLAALTTCSTKPQVRAFSAAPVLAEPCYSAPAYDQGLLFARNESTVVCWRLRDRPTP